jgi:hypothetical protein
MIRVAHRVVTYFVVIACVVSEVSLVRIRILTRRRTGLRRLNESEAVKFAVAHDRHVVFGLDAPFEFFAKLSYAFVVNSNRLALYAYAAQFRTTVALTVVDWSGLSVQCHSPLRNDALAYIPLAGFELDGLRELVWVDSQCHLLGKRNPQNVFYIRKCGGHKLNA